MRLVRPVTVHGLAVVTGALSEVRQPGLVPATAEPCRRPGDPCSRGDSNREKLRLPGTVLRDSGDVRLAIVVDLRLVLAVRRAEAAQRALRLSSRTGDRSCRSTAMVARRTNRAIVAFAPLLKPRRQRLVRQRCANRHQAPEVGQLPGKRMFRVNPTVLRVSPLAMLPVATPPGFCPARPFAARRGVRAAGLGEESTEIPAQRIRSFPRPSEGNSAPLKAVDISRR